MEAVVSEVLENILGLLAMEGSFEVTEGPDDVAVSIETDDAGRLIGVRGETIDALQLIVNQIASKQHPEGFKRVIVDVGNWRKNKEGELEEKARRWAEEVKESGHEIELEPMPAWQRRIVHLTIEEVEGVTTESVGEGRDRHLVIHLGETQATEAPAEAAQEEVASEETPAEEVSPEEVSPEAAPEQADESEKTAE